jgi:hypothetical protein
LSRLQKIEVKGKWLNRLLEKLFQRNLRPQALLLAMWNAAISLGFWRTNGARW